MAWNWVFVLVVIGVVAIAVYYFYIPSEEEQIRQSIVDASYCTQRSDCVLVNSSCPFDCYVAVNRLEAGRIAQLISEHQGRCVYGCASAPDYDCVEGFCRIIAPGNG